MPPTDSNGTGDITATYDPASKHLTWKGTYSALTGPVTAAHFHGPAKAGENAGVLVPVDAKTSPFSGEATLDDAKAADLLAGGCISTCTRRRTRRVSCADREAAH